MLAMALVVAGLPPAHAMPSYATASASSVEAAPAKHSHHDMAAGPSAPAHHHESIQAEEAPQSPNDGRHDTAPCKCLNCSQCAASFVAPFHRDVQPWRRASAIDYGFFVQGDPRAFVFIDPGIPIASM